MKSSVYGAGAAACALAAALSISVAGPHRAYAAPTTYAIAQTGDISVSLLSPAPHTSFSGAKPVEIDAFYQSTDSNQITEVDLYIDGVKAAAKALSTPESRGVISFLIDASALSAGGHSIVVRATASDAEVVSVKGSFVYVEDADAGNSAGLPAVGGDATGAPDLSITSPATDSRVEGTVRISVSAHDANGSNPYVSYFVDRQFKTLRNYPPYDYIWDTTSLPNGLHTVEIYAYNDDQNVGPAKILRLYVNNPGGFTGIRTDLKDGIAPKTAKIAAPVLRPKAVKVAPILAVKPTKTIKIVAPVLPVVAAKHIKPVLGAPTLALSTPTIKGIQTLPTINQSASVALAGQSGIDSTPTVSPLTPKSVKSNLAPARLSRVQINLNSSSNTTEIAESAGTLGNAFEPALTSPFKTAPKSVLPVKPAAKRIVGSPELAQASPIETGKPGMAAPEMQIASIRLPQDDLSSPFLATPHVVPAVVKPATLKPVMTHKVIAPVAVKPVISPKLIAPVVVKPVITHKIIAPVAVKPVITHVSIAPVTVKPVMVQGASRPMGLRPMLMAAPSVSTVTTVKAAGPIQVKVTEIRHLSVHIVATPALINLLRCKGEMAIMINDRTVRLDRPLAAHGSILFGPLRQIFEFEGGELTWTQSSRTVTGHSPSRDLSLQIGNRNATVNKHNVTLPGAPYLQRGRTMVPMTIVPEVLNANMQYDPSNGHILITSKN
jgi:hypothetical protein